MPDPNALATLLRLPSQGGSLYNRTPQPYTPNIGRNPAKTGVLSRILGLPDDGSISQQEMQGAYDEQAANEAAIAAQNAEYEAYPERISGEYGLRKADIEGRYGVEAAQAKADNQAALQAQREAFQAEQGGLNRGAIAARQQATAQSTAARQAATARDRNLGQQIGLYASGKQQAPGADPLFGWFGLGKTQGAANQEKIAELSGQIGQGGTASPDTLDPAFVASLVQALQEGDTIERLRSLGNDITPAEEAAALAQLGR